MSELRTFICDGPGCGKQKGEANRWFRAAHLKTPTHTRFIIDAWDGGELIARGEQELHLCSESCAMKVLSERLRKPHVEVVDELKEPE